LRACWSRQGRGRGRGWWLLFRTVSFRPTRDPSSARSRRASASSLLSSAATKAGSFWPPWHMMTTEATTTTTKNRLLACTAVGADCRMVHIGGARCRAAPPQCASPAAMSARWPEAARHCPWPHKSLDLKALRTRRRRSNSPGPTCPSSQQHPCPF